MRDGSGILLHEAALERSGVGAPGDPLSGIGSAFRAKPCRSGKGNVPPGPPRVLAGYLTGCENNSAIYGRGGGGQTSGRTSWISGTSSSATSAAPLLASSLTPSPGPGCPCSARAYAPKQPGFYPEWGGPQRTPNLHLGHRRQHDGGYRNQQDAASHSSPSLVALVFLTALYTIVFGLVLHVIHAMT